MIKQLIVYLFLTIGGFLVALFAFGNPIGFALGSIFFLVGLFLSIEWNVLTVQSVEEVKEQ